MKTVARLFFAAGRTISFRIFAPPQNIFLSPIFYCILTFTEALPSARRAQARPPSPPAALHPHDQRSESAADIRHRRRVGLGIVRQTHLGMETRRFQFPPITAARCQSTCSIARSTTSHPKLPRIWSASIAVSPRRRRDSSIWTMRNSCVIWSQCAICDSIYCIC